MSLDQWLGSSGVWTQFSQLGFIKKGGRIHIGGLSPENLSKVLKSLRSHVGQHPYWDPVRSSEEYILLGGDPDANPYIVYWTEDPWIDPVGTRHNQIRSDSSLSSVRKSIGFLTTERTWFDPDPY